MDLSLFGFSGLKSVLSVHPVFVHFPIALLPTSLFFYGVGVFLKKENFFIAGRWCLFLAFLGTILAVITGEMAESSIPHNAVIHQLMQVHEKIGYAILILSGFMSGWSFWHDNHKPRMVWGFISVLAVSVYLVLQNGDLGGRMVFVEGAGVKPAVSIITGETKEIDSAAKGSKEPESKSNTHDHSSHQH